MVSSTKSHSRHDFNLKFNYISQFYYYYYLDKHRADRHMKFALILIHGSNGSLTFPLMQLCSLDFDQICGYLEPRHQSNIQYIKI